MSTLTVTRAFVAGVLVCVAPSPGYDSAIQSLVSELVPRVGNTNVKGIAVVDFTDLQGCVSEFGRLIAEDLSVGFAQRASGFQVVDRTHLKTLLAEHKLSASGIIDPSTAKQVGSIAGVSALVTGTVTPFGETVKLSAKVIDTETARLIAAATAELTSTDAIKELVGTALSADCGGSTVKPQPTSRGANQPETSQGPLLVSVEGFEFQLTGCGHSGGQLACSFLVTNRRVDRRIFIRGIRLIDDQGIELRSLACQLGGAQGGQTSCFANLARDIPMRGSVVFEMPIRTNVVLLELEVESKKVQWKHLQIAGSPPPVGAQTVASTQRKTQTANTGSQFLAKAFEVIYDQGGWLAGAFSEATSRLRYCRGWVHVYPDRITFQSTNCHLSSDFGYGIAALAEARLNRLPLPEINLPAFHVKVEKGKNYNFASKASQEIVYAIQSSPEYRGK